ncbi:MAG: toll/interleukin-1 receptor domain-containing protein [Acidobacteriia bacterium]|nr:toll/interleukin-1 receptor domain-containing protein [Terriglobia bacterium]
MLLDYEADQWLLNEGGYKYHVFISWPHTINTDLTECAQILETEISRRLATFFPLPKVFLDQHELKGGDEWKERLRHELCRSVAMIAICAPIYYHPMHDWCGREWAAMEQLGECRLKGQDHKTIIPVLFKKSEPLPNAVSKIQYIDITNVILQGRRYYTIQEFRKKVESIVERVRRIALHIGENQIKANCEKFEIPEKSAFADYKGSPLPHLPLTGAKW